MNPLLQIMSSGSAGNADFMSKIEKAGDVKAKQTLFLG